VIAGLVTAAASLGLFVAWIEIGDVKVEAIAYFSRAGAFFPIALIVGSVRIVCASPDTGRADSRIGRGRSSRRPKRRSSPSIAIGRSRHGTLQRSGCLAGSPRRRSVGR
jgi:hypothetical protein